MPVSTIGAESRRLTPDFINPEKPWPHLDELRRRTEAKGFELRQRLPVYPEFAAQAATQSELLQPASHASRSGSREPIVHK